MADSVVFYFEPKFKVLICKLHGQGVPPTETAITRHLCGKGHHFGGEVLKKAISSLTKLPLESMCSLRNAHPPLDTQPLCSSLPHLRVLPGWSCMPCAGNFLTLSLEIVQCHAASQHGRRRGEQNMWEVCNLQTIFGETKDRRYFRVNFRTDNSTTSHYETTNEQYNNNDLQRRGGRREKPERQFRVMKPKVPYVPNGKSNIRKILPKLETVLTCGHPLAVHASKHVQLSTCRLNSLFKSHAFRTASEPLFDASHVDASMTMQAVFPHSEDSSVFLNAFLYSIVHISNRGKSTIEGLSFQGRTISLLNSKLTTSPQSISSADIGAIMILKTTAYKTFDRVAHIAHARGLMKVIGVCTGVDTGLTTAAKRANFWLDLFAAVFVDSERQVSHLD